MIKRCAKYLTQVTIKMRFSFASGLLFISLIQCFTWESGNCEFRANAAKIYKSLSWLDVRYRLL